MFKKLEDWKDAMKIGTKVNEEVIKKIDLGKKRFIQIIVVNKAINMLSALIIMLVQLHKRILQWNNGNRQNVSATKVRL